MRFACQSCQAKYSIPDERVAGKVVRLRCQRCATEITIRGPASIGATTPPAAESRVSAPAEPEAKSDKSEDWAGSTKIASLADIERIRQEANAAAAGKGKLPEAPPPVPLATSSGQWFVISKGAQLGPFTVAALAEKVRAQEFGARSYAWRDGMSDWRRLQNLPEFAALFAEEQAKPPPQIKEPQKSEPQKMAALADPKMPAAAGKAPWNEPEAAAPKLNDGKLADDIADLFTPPEDSPPREKANPFDEIAARAPSDPDAPPRESTRVFMAAAGLVERRRRQRIAAISAGVVFVALLTLVGLDLGGIIEIPALGPAYRAFGIDNPHNDGPASQFTSNLSEAERQKLRDGLMGKKKADAPKVANTAPAPHKAEDPVAASRPNDEQKMLNDLFADSQKTDAKIEAPKTKTPEQDLPQGIGPTEIAHVVEANQKAVRYCLERALAKGQTASGKMEVEFTIEPSGAVSAAEVKTQKFKGTDLASCTTAAVKGWKFPRFSGEPIPVEYPFVLSAGM